MIKRKPTQVPSALKSIDVKAILRKRGIYLEQKTNREIKEQAKPLAKALLKKKAKPQVKDRIDYSGQEALDYMARQIHIVDSVEERFKAKLVQFIQRIGSGFLADFDGQVKTQKQFAKFLKKDYFSDNEDDLQTAAQLDFTPLLDNLAILAGNEANKMIGLKDPYILDKLRQQIAKNIEFFTKSMLDTDRAHLTDLITNGIADGQSIPEIRGLIEADFADYSKMQATRIARTEALRVSVQAARDSYQQSGVVEGTEWLVASPTDECADYDGMVVGVNDDFPDGDPPLHPNCECTLIPVLVDSGNSTDNTDNSGD